MTVLFSLFWMVFSSPSRLTSRFHHVIIDVENVRGQAGFQITHESLFESLSVWRTMESTVNKNNLTLVMDHGSVAETYHLVDQQYSVMFSGKYAKADDIIATDLLPRLSSQRVLIVTADSKLIRRCRRIADFDVLAPLKLIYELEKIHPLRNKMVVPVLNDSTEDAVTSISTETSGLISDAEMQIALQVIAMESKARYRCTKRQRKELRHNISQYWKQLSTESQEIILDVLDYACNSSNRNRRDGQWFRRLSTSEQQLLLSKCRPLKNTIREGTNDRIVRAEQIRLQLLQQNGVNIDSIVSPTAAMNEDQTQTQPRPSTTTIVTKRMETPTSSTSTTMTYEASQKLAGLTLVVISDTHGMEDQLDNDKEIPAGDVLLHLGDFASEHRAQSCCAKLDTWLAKYPHPIKIVIRGNHDPRHGCFPKSKATYITSPTIQFISDYKFCFVPYISGGLRRKKCLPKSCDVLVSHVPPKKILDRCWPSGLHVGSQTLLRGVQGMTGGLPIVWLCGHIHEGRGIQRINLEKQQHQQQHPPTVVINASNANAGIAKSIEHGPVVLQLGTLKPQSNGKTKERRNLQILQMDGRYVYQNVHSPWFFRTSPPNQSRCLLMAVDLGIRTGVCLFNNFGELLFYEYFQYESAAQLRIGANQLLKEWEVKANSHAGSAATNNDPWQVTHVAIEGSDPSLAEAWKQAIQETEKPIALLFVKPEEWRENILTEKERASGSSSKMASMTIARRVISQYAKMKQDDTEFETDVAESILLGLYISCRLGWISDLDHPCESKREIVFQHE